MAAVFAVMIAHSHGRTPPVRIERMFHVKHRERGRASAVAGAVGGQGAGSGPGAWSRAACPPTARAARARGSSGADGASRRGRRLRRRRSRRPPPRGAPSRCAKRPTWPAAPRPGAGPQGRRRRFQPDSPRRRRAGRLRRRRRPCPRRAPLRLSKPTSSAHHSAITGSLPVNRSSSSRSMLPGRPRLITALFHTLPHVAHR